MKVFSCPFMTKKMVFLYCKVMIADQRSKCKYNKEIFLAEAK